METKNNPLVKDATLLDDFAGKAMQGICSIKDVHKEDSYAKISETAYSQAKSMIQERTKHIKIN